MNNMTQSDDVRASGLQQLRQAVRHRTVSYIAAGLGLVAGLAWNDAVSSFIAHFVPGIASTILAKVVYAIVVTLVVAVILSYLERSSSPSGR